MSELREQAKALEEEVIALRRRLQDAPKRVRTLEERLLETKGQLAQAVAQNEKLTYTLREAREHIAALREEVDKLTRPPSAYGTFLATNDDGTVDVFSGGRKMRVSLHPEIESEELRRGQEVVLNESLNVVLARGTDLTGEVVTLKEILEDGSRARWSSGGPTRSASASSSTTSSAASSGRATRCSWTSGRASFSNGFPGPRWRSSSSRRFPTSPTTTSAGSTTRSSRSPMRSSFRSSIRTCSPNIVCRRPRASCSTDRRAAARRSSPRRSPTRWPRRWPRRRATTRPGATSSTSRARSC